MSLHGWWFKSPADMPRKCFSCSAIKAKRFDAAIKFHCAAIGNCLKKQCESDGDKDADQEVPNEKNE